jgi:hypothetical protein
MPQTITDPNWGQPAAAAPSADPSDPNWGSTAAPEMNFAVVNGKRVSTATDAIGDAWDFLNTPLAPQIATAAKAIANQLDAPRLDHPVDPRAAFGAGAVAALGDLAASFTSPLGIALTLAGLGPEGAIASKIPALKSLLTLPAVRTLQRAVQVAGGAGFTTHGATRVVTAPTLSEKAQGLVEMAAGGAGVLSGTGRTGIRVPRADAPRLTAAEQASNAFAETRGIPLDAATATGSGAVAAIQKRVSHTLGGEPSALRLLRAQQENLTRVGGDLADQARGAPTSAEEAGRGVREALASKAQAHTALADNSYETLRTLEQDPRMRVNMPLPKEAVDQAPPHVVAQLRRIVHEMDASGYKEATWTDQTQASGVNRGNAGGGGWEKTPASGGAKVYQDISDRLGYETSRAQVQDELETYLGGGKPTKIVEAALKVAEDRYTGRRNLVSTPELPASEMHTPTRLEAGRKTSEEMGLPVNLADTKAALKPLHDQMLRQMPITQQQANPGLKAIGNILDGPDWSPLSVVDRDLSAIKALARTHGKLAKAAAGALDRAVQQAAANGGPEVTQPLHQGRQATIAKIQTEGLIDALPGGKLEEPVAIYKRATAPDDASIAFLKALEAHTPQVIPQLARAKIDEFLQKATRLDGFAHTDALESQWGSLGPETKRILFPDAGHRAALGQFFLLAKRIAANPQPSGTAHVTKALDLVYSLGTYPLARVLYTPRGVQAITKFLTQTPKAATAAAAAINPAQTAGWLEVLAATRAAAAAAPTALPKAASTTRPEDPQ